METLTTYFLALVTEMCWMWCCVTLSMEGHDNEQSRSLRHNWRVARAICTMPAPGLHVSRPPFFVRVDRTWAGDLLPSRNASFPWPVCFGPQVYLTSACLRTLPPHKLLGVQAPWCACQCPWDLALPLIHRLYSLELPLLSPVTTCYSHCAYL